MIDRTEFRLAISRFPSGVAVVTARHEGKDHGVTLSALCSLSLDPPMMLICVNRAAPSHDAIKGSGVFVAHVLARHQRRLAEQFARPAADKFAGVDCTPCSAGPLVLARTAAHFVCRVAHTMPAGTHTIFVSDVQSADVAPGLEPLLYHQGRFGRLSGEAHPVPVSVPPEPADGAAGRPAAFRLGSFYLS